MYSCKDFELSNMVCIPVLITTDLLNPTQFAQENKHLDQIGKRPETPMCHSLSQVIVSNDRGILIVMQHCERAMNLYMGDINFKWLRLRKVQLENLVSLLIRSQKWICTFSVTRVKCGVRSTLCWRIKNISRSTEHFRL